MSKHKNTAPEKKQQKQYVVKTSWECENCKDQCNLGLSYIEQMKISKRGNGVNCYS
jgi:hypothetical protein